MKRLTSSTVTEALMAAMEEADRMENVIILYDTKRDDEGPDTSGMFVNEGLDTKTVNYMVDCFKAWLYRNIETS
jgi:hypothetical protein